MPDIDPRGQALRGRSLSLVLSVALVLSSGWLVRPGRRLRYRRLPDRTAAPYALLFRALIRPRIGPLRARTRRPAALRPGVGPGSHCWERPATWPAWTVLGAVATGFALGAAFLNATVGLCLGCEVSSCSAAAHWPPSGPTANPRIPH
jgi:hypothetical protein